MAYTAETFLETIKPMVIEDMKRNKILASLTAAQAFIESNKGNSGLTKKANNLFGIKGNYEGQFVTMQTTEYTNGVAYKVMAQFRKYPSWSESIDDHSGLFWRASRYTNLRGCTDYKTACVNVQLDGYATSPTYSKTLISTIEKYKLYEWDREVLGTSSATSGNPYPEPTTNIKMNSRGDGAKWLQYELVEAGYTIKIDGIAGNLTIGALMDYQKKHDLTPDGICGRLTRASLTA